MELEKLPVPKNIIYALVDQHGTRYESVKGAARQLGILSSGIGHNLKGRFPSYKGYVFKYLEGEI